MTTLQSNRAVGRLLPLLVALYSLVGVAAGFAVAQELRPFVEPGVEYMHERIGDAPWSIHVVKVPRCDARFQIVSTLAEGRIYGLAGISAQVQSVQGRAVAAVNGDFFHIRPGPYQGDPIGLQIVQGRLVSAPTGASFWIDAEGQPHIGSVQARFRATGPDGTAIRFGLNEKRPEDGAVLYTPAVGASTRTSGGLELVLTGNGQDPWQPLRAGQSYVTTVSRISRTGDTPLTGQTLVLSIGPALAQTFSCPQSGETISLSLETTPALTGVPTAVGGGPILLQDGRSPTWQPPLPRHPRTTIGWNQTHLFLVVVDGRQEGLSVGMTYPELAALMKRLGCTDAMNLDGGGSSTLWLDGHIMNSPSDGRERRVANGLVIVSAQERSR